MAIQPHKHMNLNLRVWKKSGRLNNLQTNNGEKTKKKKIVMTFIRLSNGDLGFHHDLQGHLKVVFF